MSLVDLGNGPHSARGAQPGLLVKTTCGALRAPRTPKLKSLGVQSQAWLVLKVPRRFQAVEWKLDSKPLTHAQERQSFVDCRLAPGGRGVWPLTYWQINLENV